MKNYRIAERYAKVLIAQAQNDSQMEKIQGDVEHISALVTESVAFNDFVANPVIPVAMRRELLKKIFQHKVNAATLSFLDLIAQKERLDELPKICEVFMRLYDEHKSVIRAQVSSVCSLRPDQVTAIAGKLKNVFKKDVKIETSLDSGLLGGFKVQVGDLIYDYSIRTQLEKYREAVMNG